MESNQFFFDPSACHGNMLFLGNRNPVIQGARSVMNMEESSKKRPFFSSPEDLYDEEYYDEQMPEKKRRLTPEQVHMLEKSFEAENKLEPERKTQLAKKLGLQPRQVAVWFQNRRARWKTKQLERDYDLLKSTYDKLLGDYQSIVKEKENLISEVASMREKVKEKEEGEEGEEEGEKGKRGGGEERVSCGSVGSAVVDEEAPQLLDSCDSYLQPPTEYVPPILSEEDDASDDGFLPASHSEPFAWWPWP